MARVHRVDAVIRQRDSSCSADRYNIGIRDVDFVSVLLCFKSSPSIAKYAVNDLPVVNTNLTVLKTTEGQRRTW